jgi:hypothetical protein
MEPRTGLERADLRFSNSQASWELLLPPVSGTWAGREGAVGQREDKGRRARCGGGWKSGSVTRLVGTPADHRHSGWEQTVAARIVLKLGGYRPGTRSCVRCGEFLSNSPPSGTTCSLLTTVRVGIPCRAHPGEVRAARPRAGAIRSRSRPSRVRCRRAEPRATSFGSFAAVVKWNSCPPRRPCPPGPASGPLSGLVSGARHTCGVRARAGCRHTKAGVLSRYG